MDHRVNFPQVGEELIPQTLTVVGAADQPGNVNEFYNGGSDLFGLVNAGQSLQALISQRHHPHIGIHRTEWIALCRYV